MSSEVAVEMQGGRWKRYPTYRDSGVEWLGEVPEHWVVKQFKRVTTRIDVGIAEAATHAYADDGVPIIRSTNVRPGRILIDNLFYIQEWFAEKNRTKYLFENDLITVRTGAPGTTAVIPPELHGCQCFTMLITTLKPKKVPTFYSYFLNSSCARFRFAVEGWGTAQINISVPILQQQMIAEPPEKEQRAIAAFLDSETGRINTLIEKKGRQIELLQEKRAALINHVVTKGLDPDVKMKDSGVEWLGKVPEHWKMLALKRLTNLKSGEFITAESIDKDGDYPVFGGNGLRGYTTTFTHDGNYALIGRQGALCGNINYAQGQFWASEHAVVVSHIKSVETKWLGELLRAMNLNQYSVSAAQPGLSVEMISNLIIPQPPLPEQCAIAAFLDRETGRIDILTTKISESILKLSEYRTALISAAVTGKIDVREGV